MIKSFSEIIRNYEWNEIEAKINNSTTYDVISALNSDKLNENEIISLFSPAASNFLEELAKKSQEKTQKRFGKTIQLYIPL